MKKKRVKYEQVILTIPNGTLAGALTEATQYRPDKTYGWITGVWAKVLNLANQVYIDLQLRDGTGEIKIDKQHSELWSGGAGVPPDEMFRKVQIRATDGNVKPGATPPGAAATNADILVQFVFRLEDDLIEVGTA